MRNAVLAAVLSCSVLLGGCQKAFDMVLGDSVRSYLLSNPEILEEMATRLQEKQLAQQSDDARKAIAANRAALERDPRDVVINPGGKITVVEFYDYRCGYCKTIAPELAELVQENKDIRLVLKEFPIFGGASDLAARAALTPAGRAAGLDFHQALMEERNLNEATIARLAQAAGIRPEALSAALRDESITRHLADTRRLAESLRIEGTPAFIVGDRLIPGADLEALKTAIDAARQGPMKTPG
ncbi:DsbA family protein [Phenylobacterium sp.]|jgi:protein-disulfide isomerase|uniref:DsbA family protein n=1 Tax=Phenylobacterium sp. TaxID=1871053 RepID=UPI002600FC87|nr:DsbA family protein [Phenylobacterium sp.]MCA3721593.1 DsbA family protein [Phenylobacterium sp.]